MTQDDRKRGLYEKFFVQRNDGRSGVGERHEHCEYFVIDLHHDKHAALAASRLREIVREGIPEARRRFRLCV